ncbi:transmembrane protein 164-like [Aphidius gifuensis]|uniref:transmembrane protein 164-like n=1 Tax=Aphidius gifuensis TaxID=684658 RepID=UPI001CDD4CB2|nr:transmembrane protein 164-like [Aphidius gifuensis]
MFDSIIYNNINTSIPHDVGKNCAYHLIPFYQWFLEIFIVSILIIYSLIYTFKNVTLPKKIKYDNRERTGKKIILLLMAVFFGYEIGYKFSTDTIVHILSLCHIATAIQLYILVAKPSRLVTALFRIQLNYLSGPVLTFLFPQSDSRIIFAHKSVYYLQHGMMFVIVIYLIRVGGVYNVGPLHDFSWNILAIAIAVAYHYWLLLPIAFVSIKKKKLTIVTELFII